MYAVCGCGDDETRIEGHPGDVADDHLLLRAHPPSLIQESRVRKGHAMLGNSKAYADGKRKYFANRFFFTMNLVSSPGTKKIRRLNKRIADLEARLLAQSTAIF